MFSIGAWLVSLLTALALGLSPAAVASTDTATTRPAPTARVAPTPTATLALSKLPVKGRAPMTGYSRGRFGQAWLDADRNGCDTRNDTLGKWLTRKVYKSGTRGCVVLRGDLLDRYTGRIVKHDRERGVTIDIDHVVALGNAWATGAARWDVRKRAAFANDPMNLMPTSSSVNRGKGAGDAATWLPPRKSFRCAYVARQIAVKQKYAGWVTRAEKSAMLRVLARCPEQRLPRNSGAPIRVTHHVSDPGPPRTSSTPQQFASQSNTYYQNCDAVRAAGADPIRRGDPGYAPHLDRDGDGVGCE